MSNYMYITFSAPHNRYEVSDTLCLKNNREINVRQLLRGRSSYFYDHSYHFQLAFKPTSKKIYFKFGCEVHQISYWTPANIRKLCKKHLLTERLRKAFYSDISNILKLCRSQVEYHQFSIRHYVEPSNTMAGSY